MNIIMQYGQGLIDDRQFRLLFEALSPKEVEALMKDRAAEVEAATRDGTWAQKDPQQRMREIRAMGILAEVIQSRVDEVWRMIAMSL
jgi:hypothetical protein